MAIFFKRKLTGAQFQHIYDAAHEAGYTAGKRAIPNSKFLAQPNGAKLWIEPRGECGMAWIAFSGNTPWSKWCNEQGICDNDHPRGKRIWVHHFGQSYERKLAYAKAFAQTLKDNGINAFSCGMVD